MADHHNRSPPGAHQHMFEFESSLPPGALLPSIPGYSPPDGRQHHPSSPPQMSSTLRDSYGRDMHGANDFGAYNPGGARASATLPSPRASVTNSNNSPYATRDLHGALPPVPPRPREGTVRRALPKLPGVSESAASPPFQTPPRSAAIHAQTSAPQPPPRPATGKRALPTPPSAPSSANPPAGPSRTSYTASQPPPPLPPPPQSLPPTYDQPRPLHNQAAFQQGAAALPHPPPLPAPPSTQQQQSQKAQTPSRNTSVASSSFPSHVSHNTADSFFGTPSDRTSLTSHPTSHSNWDKATLDANHHGIRESESPYDDFGLAYDRRSDEPEHGNSDGSEAHLSSTPRGPSWTVNHQRTFTPGGPPSVNSQQTEVAPTPQPRISEPTPIPTPSHVPDVAFPRARPTSESPATVTDGNFPSARMSPQGVSPHLGKDLYEEMGIDPELLDGQHDPSFPFPEQPVASSSNNAYLRPDGNGGVGGAVAGPSGDPRGTQWAERSNRGWVQTKLALHQQSNGGGAYYEDEELYDDYASSGEEDEDEEEMNEFRFFNPAYLSETAVQVRDRVIRGEHVKGGMTWPKTFTGKDLVTTIQSFMPAFTRDGPADRRFALQTARSLHSQLWILQTDWEHRPVRDSPDDVFKFMSEMEDMGEDVSLPKGVLTMATKCYSSSCTGAGGCYSPRCPYATPPNSILTSIEEDPVGPSRQPVIMVRNETDWTKEVPPAQLAELSEEQHLRQTLIRQAILLEERYESDLAIVEQAFITPLQTADPPIVQPYGKLDQYVRTLFSNMLEIRRASRSLLEIFAICLRDQGPLVETVGDIFLEAGVNFRSLYPSYTDNLPKAEALLSQALDENRPFAYWIAEVSKNGSERRHDLRYLLKRPAMHLQNYPQIIEEILRVTPPESPDGDYLREALESIQSISYLSRLKLFQASKGRGPHGQLTWKDIVSPTVFDSMSPHARTRQFNIWELIQGEMEYVADLEAIDESFITPLREADRPIIDRSRLEVFIHDVFHNYRSILGQHERLLSQLHERQLEQHPNFGKVSDLIYDAALNWNEAYMEYMPNFPIAKAKVDDEKRRNPAFAAFLDQCYKNPLANRRDINHFIYRPIARLLRYKLLLDAVLKATVKDGPPDHEDIKTIPQVMEVIHNLAQAGQKGVDINNAKVQLWDLKTTLDGGKFGPRVVRDLDLLQPMRELIHKGKVYRQPEGTIGAWSELHLLLFDNYFVLVKQGKSKNKDSPPRYTINRRPVPLELLSLGDFSQPSQNRSIGVLNKIGGKTHNSEGKEQTQSDSRQVWPFTFSITGAGLSSGQYTLWTDSDEARRKWHERLKHAKVLRTEVNEAGKVFELTPLSLDTFYMAPGYGAHPHANQEYTGRVTCSVPFVTVDRRNLVAVGCEQGVWIGVQRDPPSLRKVLHVKSVTQIAVLEEFGIFLVLADKSLLAYHLEALVPTHPSSQARSAPQRLSGVRDIVFFAVGQISGRTLVLYVKRKGIDTVFRVLEPVLSRGAEERRRGALGGLLGQRSEWFRLYKEFFIPTEAVNVHFLKAKIAIVCSKGFEIMGLDDLRGGSIPIFDPNKARERPALAELARRCEAAKPIAMFRSTDREFILCYHTFGIYVDRHGEPNRDLQPVEWEGTPENIVFHPPYLLLISPSFIEVRHIDTAKLLQIYTGVDIRCTWDGTGGMAKRHNDAPGPKGWGEEVTSTEPRIHICKRTDDPRRTKGIAQHVYELTPTLLLNNPLLNPVHTHDPNYFPPAPLNHRTSMSNSSYTDGAYVGDMQSSPYAGDRQSVSSASTTTYPNGLSAMTGMGGQNYPGGLAPHSQTNLLHPSDRRVSDMSTPSVPSAQGGGGSGFELSTVYQNEVRDDYEHFGRGSSREYDRAGYQGQPIGTVPQRHSSNEWSSPAHTTSQADAYEQYGGMPAGAAGYPSQAGYPQSGYQAPATRQQYPQQNQQQATHGAHGAHDYAQVSQAGPNDYAQVSQADYAPNGYQQQQQYEGYPAHQRQQGGQQGGPQRGYQGGAGYQSGYYQ